MKNFKRIFISLLLVVALVGCSSNKADDNGSNNDEIISDIPEGTEVTFWHAMNGAQEDALTKITEDFMDENENITIKLQNQGSYPDLQAKINSTLISPKDLPTITQAYPNWLWNAAQDDLLVDLDPYINNEEIGIDELDDINSTLLEAGQIEDVQYGIPFNKSTEVLYYNKTLLDEHNLEVPTTMEELKEVSQAIYEKTNGDIVGAGFDSLNNYYAIGLQNEGLDISEDLDVTSQESKDIVNFYNDGVKDGYFRIAGEDMYLSGPFGSQTIAMNIGSMAGESHIKKAAGEDFEYGVADRPSEINLQQGTDIYMFSESSAEEKSAAFIYMNYLMSSDAQLYWAQETGYMPVRTSVVNSDEYKNNEDSKIPAILGDATENLFAIPVLENADPAYNLSSDMMERVLSDDDADVDEELEKFKTEFDATWNQ